MRPKFYIVLQFICFIFFWGCYALPESEIIASDKIKITLLLSNVKTDTSIKYAKRFSIAVNRQCKVVYLFGNSKNRDTTSTFIFLKDSSLKINSFANTYIFRSPCKKIATLSSVYTNMLCELEEIDHIAAIENIDYYNNTLILNKHTFGTLPELSKNPVMDVEKTIVLNPDIIFNFGMGNSGNGPNEKILLAKIPIAMIVDHLEETPLARAEWIKFFAAFVNKEQQANSVFSSVEENYLHLKNAAASSKTKPSVLTEVKYGDIWYVPGGKSFMSAFLKDAGAEYIWKDNSQTGSLNLSFEEVYSKAKNADFWLNLSLIRSKKELSGLEKRYSQFKAYKTGNLYNNNKVTNKNGYSTYWETGIMYPDKVLNDLILIFHPELKSELKSDLNYYKKLN